MIKLYGITYKTLDGRTISKYLSNEKMQTLAFNVARMRGFTPLKFERVIR